MNETLIILVAVMTFLQVGYYGFFFRKFAAKKSEEKTTFPEPVSVIIACHNEAKNIENHIDKWINQDFPVFELVLIDDASTDDTALVLQKIAAHYNNVQIVSIASNVSYKGNKKNALTTGIEKAKYEYLLFTDADCIPASEHWISEMSKGFTEGKSLVLGYGKYAHRNTFLNKLIRYETLLTAWQYFSYALWGMPYMGVGRNMAYTKSIFQKAKGFSTHTHLKSGDDDLLVSEVGNAENTAVIFNEQAFTVSIPKETWTDWFRQKRRHITTSSAYKMMHKVLLSVFYISQIGFYVLFFILIFKGLLTKFVIFVVVLRFVAYYSTLLPVAKKLKEQDLILFAPILEGFLIVSQGFIFVSNVISKPKNW